MNESFQSFPEEDIVSEDIQSSEETDELRKRIGGHLADLLCSNDPYADEFLTGAYSEEYGEFHMSKALRWGELMQQGLNPREAHIQVQQEFASAK